MILILDNLFELKKPIHQLLDSSINTHFIITPPISKSEANAGILYCSWFVDICICIYDSKN